MRAALRTCLWYTVLFGCMSLLWWEAQRSAWWLWALTVGTGLVLAHSEGDIKAAWRKRRHRKETSA